MEATYSPLKVRIALEHIWPHVWTGTLEMGHPQQTQGQTLQRKDTNYVMLWERVITEGSLKGAHVPDAVCGVRQSGTSVKEGGMENICPLYFLGIYGI